MATISARLRVQEALRSKLPPSTHYLISPGDMVFVYREDKSSPRASGAWQGPFTVASVAGKQIAVDY